MGKESKSLRSSHFSSFLGIKLQSLASSVNRMLSRPPRQIRGSSSVVSEVSSNAIVDTYWDPHRFLDQMAPLSQSSAVSDNVSNCIDIPMAIDRSSSKPSPV